MEAERVVAAVLEAFAAEILEAAGAESEDAATVASTLMWAQRRQRPGHGLARLPNAVRRLQAGLVRSPAKLAFTRTAPACGLLDGGDALGPVAAGAGLEHAIALADTEGLGLCAVRRSGHFGAAGYYASRAANAGYLALVGTNAAAKVAPHGGVEPVLGTNPLAFGCPVDDAPPLVADLSTSAVSGAAIRDAERRGQPLPEGVALDENGNPTREPGAAHCLLPAAGPKGFALGLMVEILSAALSGAAVGRAVGSIFRTWDRPTNSGHFFLALRIDATRAGADVRAAVAGLMAQVHACAARPGVRVAYPGQHRAELAAEADRGGVLVETALRADLTELAASLGVASPWA